jgi:hypothetical protein
MNMSKAAQQSKTGSWIALTPISIETGFDLLTTMGRLKAENYLRREKPDLIIGEWMCGPFSQFQNINMAKSPEMRNKIIDLRKAHKKVSAWIARQEQWQRLVNKGHWIGEQPARCGSWNLQCLQEMQEESYNTDFDMCSVGLTCPETEFLMRKRTKLNHTSSILHEFFEEFRQCSKDHQHQSIEGHTRYLNERGEWRTISRGVFAGWYTPQFCSDVISCFEEEFAKQDQVDQTKRTRKVHFSFVPDVAAVHTTGSSKSIPIRGAYLPTKHIPCPHCSAWYSSSAALHLHLRNKHPEVFQKKQQSIKEMWKKPVVTPEKNHTESGMQSELTPLEVTSQMSDDTILDAPNFDSKTTSTVSPGDKFRMTSLQSDSLVDALQIKSLANECSNGRRRIRDMLRGHVRQRNTKIGRVHEAICSTNEGNQ